MKRKCFVFNMLVCAMMLLVAPLGCGRDRQETGAVVSPKKEDRPVVQWTVANDPLNFKYNFLENVKTVTLLKATPETGTFSHHPYVTYFKKVLFANWDIHARDEAGPGTHGVFRRSTDGGKTWSPLEQLFPPLAKNVPAGTAYEATRFQVSHGFAVVDDVLYAVTNVSDWQRADHRKATPRIQLGRLARSVCPDGSLGEIFWLVDNPPEPVEGFEAYPVGDPVLVEKLKAFFRQPGNEPQLVFERNIYPASDDGHSMNEPAPAWQLADGTWVKLYRDQGFKHAENFREQHASRSQRNYASFSFDDGATWATPTRTSFPDACSRTNAGKLPDGQVYVINNVLPLSTRHGGRSLLAISLSRDGLNFDRMAVIHFRAPDQRYEGRARSIGYAYPHSVVVGDYLWVIYSVNKEDVEIARIPVSELNNL